ncbi:MAG: GDYXXLXY domain-containing protein [Leptolyngbya sp. SIO1E4]|nr:GDYXXLXY domain-containing protein [Leptolyngbya sp. SIO1E4]
MTKTGARFGQRGLWAIALPLLIQTGLIVSVPLRAAIARVVGKTVVLQTVPVDPYDPFRGYYTTLRYDISQRGFLSTLDGWDTVKPMLESASTSELLEPGRPFFVMLEVPETGNAPTVPPAVWQPVAVSRQRPQNLSNNQIALKGIYRSDHIIYGLERYYLPEAERIDLDQRIRAAQTVEESPRLQVEVRIGPFGNAVPIALWLQDERIMF